MFIEDGLTEKTFDPSRGRTTFGSLFFYKHLTSLRSDKQPTTYSQIWQ